MSTKVTDLQKVDYQKAWDLQKELVEQRKDNSISDQLLLCEHNHVYTFGKSADRKNLLINDSFLQTIGAQKFEIERGGDITYHGPGQLVGYPILDLNSLNIGVRRYVELLEQSLIDTLEGYDIFTDRIEGLTGIWLKEGRPRKIAAIGIKISRGITMHGFALNANTDLNFFKHIVPCGIPDKEVTSMAVELGKEIDFQLLKSNYLACFTKLLFD